MFGDVSTLGWGGLVERGPQLLGGLPGDGAFVGLEGSLEPVALPVGEVFAAAARGSVPTRLGRCPRSPAPVRG